jgi:alginate O-acetyltransferase complex protein AlgI
MVFSSPYFIFIFLPAALLICLLLRKAAYLPAIFLTSLIFYFWSSGNHVLILLAIIVLNYFGALLIERERYRWLFYVFLAANIAIIFTYKYLAFFARNVDLALGSDLATGIGDIALPAGISFFVFQGISYLVDVRRRDIKGERNFIVYAAYQAFFPHLIAGPIVRFRDVIEDFLKPRLSTDLFAAGITRFAHGLFKKVVIADSIAPIADSIFGLPADQLNFTSGWIGAVAYALQIYFDFSGYSDMAIGMAAMFGIRFTENFARPYASRSITEFWRRWHMTLSSWFRDYVYIPLGGSRGGTFATYRNLLLVFIVTGIWHGAAWTFLVWGLYHGAFLIVERALCGTPLEKLTSPVLRYVYCLPVVIFGWVVFRADTITHAAAMWSAMLNPFSMSDPAALFAALEGITPTQIVAFILGCGIFLVPSRVPMGAKLMTEQYIPVRQAVNVAYTAVVLLVSGGVALTGSDSPFLYFTF